MLSISASRAAASGPSWGWAETARRGEVSRRARRAAKVARAAGRAERTRIIRN